MRTFPVFAILIGHSSPYNFQVLELDSTRLPNATLCHLIMERREQQHMHTQHAAMFSSNGDADDTAWISDDSEMPTPQFVAAHDARGADASDDEVEVPSPAVVHRDSHASFVWTHAPRGPVRS